MKTAKLKNLDMNEDVYALRRAVIDLIYEAKETLPDLPRIEVRITVDSDKLNGVARMSEKMIWIPANSAKRSRNELRRTVFHEICHAVFGTEHVNGCALMGPVYKDIDKRVAHRLLLKYAKKTYKEVVL